MEPGTDEAGADGAAVDAVTDLYARAARIRTEMGGADKVARIAARGGRTVRQRIDALVDTLPGDGSGSGEGQAVSSFRELGTFTRSKRPEDRHDTPGDGKIGGHALIDGRPVVVFGDDITVRQGSSSTVGGRKEERLMEHALRHGNPIVHLGETGGGRIPDILGAAGISEIVPFPSAATRCHRVPMATVIVGKSFGGSSFLSAMSDFTVQVRGSCLAVTSPRVFEVATGEIIGFEELGGVDVHATVTGQIDLDVDTDDEAWAAVRRWLSFLPSNAWTAAPRGPSLGPLGLDPAVAGLVAGGDAGYDGRRLVAALVDPGSYFELRPRIGRSLTTGFARIDGWPVGVIGSNPAFDDGALCAAACEKATRLLVVCDSFDVPVVVLQDTPGLRAGLDAERDRVLFKATRLRQAMSARRCPLLTVVVRRGFGLAFRALGGSGMRVDALYAWPGARIGWDDPADPHLPTAAYEAAGVMLVDEVIDPATTRATLAADLGRLAERNVPPPEQRPLSYWATC